MNKCLKSQLLCYLYILLLWPITIYCAVDIPEGSNHPPSFNLGPDQETHEDKTINALSNFAQNIKPGPPNESDQNVSFHLSADNPDLFSEQPTVSPDGVLRYSLAPDKNGSTTVSIYLKDDGGTDNDGVDQSETQTFRIIVHPVNDPPSFNKGDDQSIVKNAELQVVPGWATRINKGPADEINQKLNFILDVDRKEMFEQLPEITPDGVLTYEPARDAYGQARVTVVLKDDGGLSYGGIDTSPEQTFIIAIIWSNHAPSFSKGPDIVILEDAPAQTYDEWATNIKAGPAEESFQNVFFHLAIEQQQLFDSLPDIMSNGRLTFRPKENANGKTLVNVFLQDDGGTEYGGQDQSDTHTFFIEIKPVNDPPTFTPGPDQTIPQNSDIQLVTAWAKNISPGPPDEIDQKVQFLVSTDKPELFHSPPVILSNGALQYTPAENAYGNAVVTVILMDNGGTYDNGKDTSEPVDFSITILAVNHAPFFTPGNSIMIPEDNGMTTFERWATGISAGTPEESYQQLTFYAFANPPTLFIQQPEMLSDGTLFFETAPDVNGQAHFRIFLKDDGGTENGGQDQSDDYNLEVNITPVNDAPRTVSDTMTILEDTPTFYTLTAIDIENDPITFDIFLRPQKGTLVLENPATGRCLYTPYTDSVGTDRFEFQAFDHMEQSEPALVTIQILPVNDAPTLSKIQNQTTMEDIPTSPIDFYVSDTDSSFDQLSLSVTSDNETLVPDANIHVQGSAGKRSLIITPEPNQYGSALITLRITDNSGLYSQEQFILDVQKLNDPPTLTGIDDQIIYEDQTTPPITFSVNDSETPVADLNIEITVSDPQKIPQENIKINGVDVVRTITLKPISNVSGDIEVTVRVIDSDAASIDQSFILQILPVNDPPVISNILDQRIYEDELSQKISFSVSDPDSFANNIMVTAISSNENIIPKTNIEISGDSMDRTIQFTPAQNQSGNLQIKLIATDGLSDSDMVSFNVTVVPVNDPPIAEAGENFAIGEGRTTYLDAIQSIDPENQIILYQWSQVTGEKVTIQNNTKSKANFVAPQVGPNGMTLVFKLLIIDHKGEESEDTIEITVEDMAGQYMIEAIAGNNGSIEPSGQLFVPEYTSKTFQIRPNTNYIVQDVMINGDSVGPLEEYTFHDIDSDQTIHAFFIARPQITTRAEGYGQISPEGTVFVDRGDNLTVSFIPDDGHKLDYILVDNIIVAPKPQFNFTDIQFDHEVVGYFISTSIFVETEAGKRGRIEPSGKILMSTGSDLNIQFIPDPGYEVADVQVNGTSIGAVTKHTLHNIRSNMLVYARFQPIIAQTITASSGDNGHIFPEGETKVSDGLAQSFVMIPDDNFQVADVLIDNVSMGAMDRYTFPSVQRDYQIHVTFKHKPMIISSAGPNGAIDPQGEIFVNKGWYQQFAIQPDENFEIKDVRVNGETIGQVSDHVVLEVNEDLTIEALFQPMPRIHATTNNNGQILPSGTIIVPRNSFNQFKMTPNPGYRFDQLVVNGKIQPLADGQILYTVPAITKDYTLYARFVLDQYAIQASSGAFGSITPTGTQTFSGFDTQTYQFIPNPGYEVKRVLVDGENIGRVPFYTLASIISDHTIHVDFIQTPIITATAGEHGEIHPQGIVEVHNGDYQMFLIKPEKGYKVKSILVDGEPVSAKIDDQQSDNLWKSYVFPNVFENHTIAVTFNQCQIDLRTNGNGKIEPDRNLVFDVFDNVSFTFTPNSGFVVDEVIVDRVPLGPRTFYNFWELSQDHILEVNFKAIEIQTLTVTASTGGSITPSGTIQIMGGEYAEFMVSPDDMYALSTVLLNGKPISENTDNTEMLPVGRDGYYVSLNVTSNQTIEAQFEEIPQYTIRSFSGDGGRIDPSGTITVIHGQYQLFTFLPDPGHAIDDVEIDNISQGPVNSLSLSVMNDHIITVSFDRIHTRVIQGTVVDRENTIRGLQNFLVEVWQGDTLLQTTTTNVNGEYKFENLPATDGLVMAAWPPLGNSDYYGRFYNDKKDRLNADPISTLNSDLDDIQFKMQRTFEEGIRGQVREGDKGISSIVVDVFEDSATFVKNVLTDENGFYTLTGLDPSEDYKVSVWYQPYGAEYFYSIPDFVKPGEETPTYSVLSWDRARVFRSQYPPLNNIDIIIDPGEIISGRVSFPDGSPVQGIRVNAFSKEDQSGNGALTNNSGHYTITNLNKVTPENADAQGYIVEIQSVKYPYVAYPQAQHYLSATPVATGRTDIDIQVQEGFYITGTVYNPDNSPAANIRIRAWSKSDPDKKNGSTLSDNTGAYTIANLPIASDYIVSAISDEYPVIYFPNVHQIENAQTVYLMNQETGIGIDIILDKGSLINGYVYIRDDLGTEQPASGIWVNVWSESTKSGGDVITNEQGFFEQTGLFAHADDYRISVIHPDYQPAFYKEILDDNLMNDTVYQWKDAGSVSPTTADEPIYRNIVMDKGVTFAGMVTYDNQPVANVTVELFSDDTGGWGTTVSNDRTDANMIVSGLIPGIYTVKASMDEFADIKITGINLEHSIMDYNIQLDTPDRSISGTLIGLNQGETVRINAWSSETSCNGFVEVTGSGFATHFTIKGLKPASDYILETYSQNYPRQIYDGRTDILAADQVDVSIHDANVVFRFENKGLFSILGHITFPQDAISGESVLIQAWSKSTDTLIEQHLTYTEDNSVLPYTLAGNAPAEDYVIGIQSNPFIDRVLGEPLNTITNNKITDLDFILQRGSQISGKVTDSQNLGINQLTVIAWSDELASGGETQTLVDGRFTISGLAQGSDYRIEVIHDRLGRFYYNEGNTTRERSQAQQLDNSSGSISGIHIMIIEGVSIQGHVTDLQGKPLSGIWVDAWSVSTLSGNGTFTDNNGYYKIFGLASANDYLVQALPERGYLTVEKNHISAPSDELDFQLTATTGFRVPGTVFNCNEKPLQLARVELQSASQDHAYGWAITAADGSYEISQLPAATDYVLTVVPPASSEAAFKRINSISISTDKRMDIYMEPELIFSGLLTDNKTRSPVSNASVVVFSASTGFWDETQSNENGMYEIHHVPKGSDYMLIVNSKDHLESKKSGLTPGVHMNFTLETGGQISGVVKLASTGQGMPDVPVEIFSVSNAGLSNFGGIATTDANGQFQVGQLKINDHQGLLLDDYVVFIYPENYPPQSRGNKSTGDLVDFVVAGGETNIASGTVPRFESVNHVFVDVFENDGFFVKSVEASLLSSFYVHGLHANKKYQFRFEIQFDDNSDDIVQWAGENDMGVNSREDAVAYSLPATIYFTFQNIDRKRTDNDASKLSEGPGPVQNLNSSSHAFQIIGDHKRAVTTSGPETVSNDPNVTVGWDPPKNGAENLVGYYGIFTDDPALTITKLNTAKKAPIRTRKITSRDLEGDDISYYFHVAAVDKEGRIGQKSSIAFRIDTVPPTNVSVIAPDISVRRNIQLQLGAGGATEMFISNNSYQSGGTWEKLSQQREWQLPPGNGEKSIYVRFRDRAGNLSQTMTKTSYTQALPKYTIQLIAGDHGSISPTGSLIKEKGDSLSIHMTPASNYRIGRVTLDGKAISSKEPVYHFENIQADHRLTVSFEKALYKIVSSAGEHGQISPDGEIFVEKGSAQAFMITPDNDYSVDQLLFDMTPIPWTGNPFVIDNIDSGHQLFVSFTRSYTVTSQAGENGQIIPQGQIAVGQGKFQQFEIIPDKGFDIDQVLVNGSLEEIFQNKLTVYNVLQPYDITVSFKKVFYTIESISGQHGHIDSEGLLQVQKNSQMMFNIIPDKGYEIEQLLVDGVSVQNATSYTFTDIAANHSIAASFQSRQFIVKTVSGPNGSVEPSGDIALNWGDQFILIVEAASGYAVDKVLLDNQPVTLTAGYYYTLSNIVANHDFSVTFKRVHQIAAIVSGNGHAEPSGIVLVEKNQNQSFELLPDYGHQLNKLQIDDAYVSLNDLFYTFEKINEDHQLIATFTPIPVEITATSGANGKISPSGIITYDMGSKATFMLSADPGFEVATLTVDNSVMPYTKTHFTIASLDAPHRIAVDFQLFNYPPTVTDASFHLVEDSSFCGRFNGKDGDGDLVTFEIVSMPSMGNAIVTHASQGEFCYTPAENVNGTDQLTFQALDYGKASNLGIVTFKIQAQNDAPEAMNGQWTVSEDALLQKQLTAVDIDNDPLTYTIVENPLHGQAVMVDKTTGAINYQPKPDVFGDDRIVFQVSDGRLLSNTAEIIIDIQAVNDPPISYSSTLETGRGQPLQLTLQASDIDNDPLTYEITSPPTSGEITTIALGIVEYQPKTDFIGTDSFEFQVSDGTDTSNTAIVSIVIGTISAVTLEEQAVTLTVMPGATITEAPSNGSFQWIADQLLYTPSKDYVGYDSLRYQNPDDPVIREIVIRIEPVNDPPVFKPINTVVVNEDEWQSITIVTMDPDNDPVKLSFTLPEHGTIVDSRPILTYYPSENYHGPDQFIIQASDGKLDVSQKIDIEVISKNDVPIIAPLHTVEVLEDHSVNITITATDVDQDNLLLQIVDSTENGQLTGQSTNMMHLAYTPLSNFSGWDHFTFLISDSIATTTARQLSIHVLEVNDPPVAYSQSITGIENIDIVTQLDGSDIEIQTLVYDVFNQAENGMVSITPTTGQCVYTPEMNFVGEDMFSFTVSDGYTQSSPATVHVTVIMGNHPPEVVDGKWAVYEDTPANFTLTATDTNNDKLTFRVDSQPTLGQIEILDSHTGQCRYMPNPNKYGTDILTFIASDGLLDSKTATITIDITPVNDRPHADDSTLSLDEDFEKQGNLTGSDIDGDPLSFQIVIAPENGLLALNDAQKGLYSYSPFPNYHGTDAFQFIARDSSMHSLTATVTIVIASQNDTPSANPLFFETIEDTEISGQLEGSDIDNDPLQFMIVDEPDAVSKGILEMKNPLTGEFKYYPPPDQYGEYLFQYYVYDGKASSTNAPLTINVLPGNDSPEVFNQDLSTDIQEPLLIILSGYDIDHDVLAYEIENPPKNGTLTNEGIVWKYSPKDGFQGNDYFTFRANDQSGTNTAYSNIGKVYIRVSDHDADFFTQEDNKVDIDLLFKSDFQAENVTNYQITIQPEHGSLKGSGQSRTYAPDPNYSGMDTFTVQYTVVEQTHDRNMRIYIMPVNDPPTLTGVEPSPAFTYEDQPLTLTVNAIDPDASPSALRFKLTHLPKHGQASILDNIIHYMPSQDYSGDDQLTVAVSDGFSGFSSSQTIDIQVEPANDAPIAFDDTVQTLEEQRVTIEPQAFDKDSASLIFTIQEQPSSGSLQGQSPLFTYVPHPNFFGTDRLTFIASDTQFTSDPAEIIIKVRNVNDTPIVDSLSFSLDGNSVKGRLTATDADNDILIYSVVQQPAKGLLTFVNPVMGTFLYFPHEKASGMDTFSYKVNDGSADSNTALVNITLSSDTTINEFAELQVLLKAPYQPNVTSCTYMLIDADTGQLIFKGSTQKDTIDVTLPKGDYRLLIIAPNYKPYEYEHQQNQKYFSLNENLTLPVSLEPHQAFDPHPAGVDISYMTTPNGIKIWAVKKNLDKDDQFYMHILTPSGEIPVDSENISGNGSSNAPYTYEWTSSVYWPEDNEVTFIFYGGPYGHAQKLESISLEWQENQYRKRGSSVDDTDIITDEFGQHPMYISQGTGEFYPLVGTDCHATLMDNQGAERHMTIHIPPIPLEYLYIDDGQLNYNPKTDRYNPDPYHGLHGIAPDQKLQVNIKYYTFGSEKAGNGISLSFYMAEGNYSGQPVHFNPVLMSDYSRRSNAPTIVLPIYLNTNSEALKGKTDLQDIVLDIRINEKGDGVKKFRSEKVPATIADDGLVYVEMNHLTIVGLNVVVIENNTQAPPVDADSSGCFMGNMDMNTLRWHEIVGFVFICFLIGLILRINKDARSS